jgi:hypothetical protein
MKKLCLITIAIGLFALSVAAREVGPDETWKRTALSAQAFPGQKTTLYVEVPSADSAISNAMVRAFIGSSQSTRQITSIMARGAQSSTYLVVGSASDSVAYSALRSALNSFKGQALPQLHLALIGDPRQAEGLRSSVEALGAEYRVLSSPPGE